MAFVNIPPNFQDMFYALSDRIAKLETGPNQAMEYAESAQGSSTQASEEAAQALLEASEANTAAAAASAQAVQAATAAGIAQAQATTALAQANAAFISANNSLKPSADTIVNAQNQMTAISTNGITVFSGASSTSGARVVMNSAGLAGFNSSGTATFSISASTGAATFSGNVTGSTITGGTLNIAGNAIINSSGLLTATGATITGTINATSGYFGTQANGWSISSTGLVGVGSGTIVGGIISGTTFTNGSTFSVTSSGFLTATSGSIGGVSISSGALTGGTIQTSDGATAVIMNGASNALQFKVSGSVSGNIVPLGSAGVIMHYGSTPDGTGSTYPKMQVTSTSATIAGATTNSMSAGATGNTIVGNTQVTGSMTFAGVINANNDINGGTSCEIYAFRGATNTTTGNAANAWLNSTTGRLARSTSSLRYKVDAQPQSIPLESILALEPKSFFDKIEYDENPESAKRILGLIAEEVAEIPVLNELLVNYDSEGRPDAIAYPTIAVAILPLLKDLHQRVKALEG